MIVEERICGRIDRPRSRHPLFRRFAAARTALRVAVDQLERTLVEAGALPFEIGDRWLFDGHHFMERTDLSDRWGTYGVRWSFVREHASRIAMMEALDDATLQEACS